MGAIGLILVLALLGVITWAVITYIPMPKGFKNLIVIVAVVVAVVYVLNAFGVIGRLPDMRVPQVR
jgi:hypothetical protein